MCENFIMNIRFLTFYQLIMKSSLFWLHHKLRLINDKTGTSNFLPDYGNVSRMPSSQHDMKILQ